MDSVSFIYRNSSSTLSISVLVTSNLHCIESFNSNEVGAISTFLLWVWANHSHISGKLVFEVTVIICSQ